MNWLASFSFYLFVFMRLLDRGACRLKSLYLLPT